MYNTLAELVYVLRLHGLNEIKALLYTLIVAKKIKKYI